MYRKNTLHLLFVLAITLLLIAGSTAQDIDTSAPGEYPIVEEPVTLTVLLFADASVENHETNAFTEWYEERTGINLEIQTAAATSGHPSTNETLTLTLASGDLPDILVGFALPATTLSLYGDQGLFLPLRDLIDEYGFYTKQVLENSSYVEPIITSPNGEIYGLPSVNECFHCFYSQRAYINQQWLDNLGLSMPQTTEELFEVLIAFKEQDANGNGDPNDEIPFAASPNGWNTNLDGFIMNPFVYSEQFNNHRYLMLEDGEISSIVNTEGWREGLRYLNRLYENGLLGEESFTQDIAQVRQLVEAAEAPRIGMIPAGFPGVFSSASSDNFWQYVAAPPLEGPTGLQQTPYNPFWVTTGNCVISAQTDYPELAFRWCDGLYETETTLRSTQGVPGINWDWAEEGQIGINGEPAIWQVLEQTGEIQNAHWGGDLPNYRTAELRLGSAVIDPDRSVEVKLFEEANNIMKPYARSQSDIIPPLSFSADQAQELADLRLVIEDYVQQMEAEFITGRASLDEDWDTYVATLEELGLARVVEIYQATYEAQSGA